MKRERTFIKNLKYGKNLAEEALSGALEMNTLLREQVKEFERLPNLKELKEENERLKGNLEESNSNLGYAENELHDLIKEMSEALKESDACLEDQFFLYDNSTRVKIRKALTKASQICSHKDSCQSKK